MFTARRGDVHFSKEVSQGFAGKTLTSAPVFARNWRPVLQSVAKKRGGAWPVTFMMTLLFMVARDSSTDERLGKSDEGAMELSVLAGTSSDALEPSYIKERCVLLRGPQAPWQG